MALVRTAAEVVLESGGSVFLSWSCVGDKKFYAFTQTDRKIERILLGCRTQATHRPLSSVAILRTLKELHDKHVWQLIDPGGKRAGGDRHAKYSKAEMQIF